MIGTHSGSMFNILAALQIGPDGKIYCACQLHTKLAVIDEPDELGMACNFIDNHIDLNGRYCLFGLPQVFYNPSSVNYSYTNQCLGDSTSFTLQDNTTNGIDSVIWNFDDTSSGIYNFSKVLNPKHLFDTSGLFDVILIYFADGTSDTLIKSVFISNKPFAHIGNDTTICVYNTAILDAGNPGCSYIWSTGETTDFIVCSTNSDTTFNYSVTVTNNYGCENIDSINITFDPCVSLREHQITPSIDIFPNPTSGKFKIHPEFSGSKSKTDVEMQIMNIHGQEILRDNFIINSSLYQKEINLSKLPKGIYFISFISENFVKTKKLVVK